ncbi:hypothetical protein PHMEG_00013176 [Phytophthora megakarya]|uniref:Bzip transcription factor n=1 Tax=Phytophthora megakarya TaxID=4795 RepID=A0A225W8K9_9STRA|nr:hypothetical protein PHMEG_00013176 [Phytophthora megakarya]
MCNMRLSEHCSHTMRNQTPWNMVSEYYRFVSRGIRTLSAVNVDHFHSTRHYQFSAEVFHQFLKTNLVPRVISGGGIGVEAHLEEWKTISAIYPDFDMKIVRMEEGPSGEVVVTSKTVLVFSESTFRNAFPHVISNDYMYPIVDKLLGQALEIDTVARFTWDDLVKRVADIKFQADMMSPLLSVLGSLDDVAGLFRSALVTTEGQILVV